MSLTQYDPSKVVITFGPVLLQGFAAGTFLKVSANTDSFKKSVGSLGDVVRTKILDKSASIEVTLQQNSPSNPALSAALSLDEQVGEGVYPLQVKDLKGNVLVTCAQAWIVKRPDIERGDDASDIVWMFDCDRVVTIRTGQ